MICEIACNIHIDMIAYRKNSKKKIINDIQNTVNFIPKINDLLNPFPKLTWFLVNTTRFSLGFMDQFCEEQLKAELKQFLKPLNLRYIEQILIMLIEEIRYCGINTTTLSNCNDFMQLQENFELQQEYITTGQEQLQEMIYEPKINIDFTTFKRYELENNKIIINKNENNHAIPNIELIQMQHTKNYYKPCNFIMNSTAQIVASFINMKQKYLTAQHEMKKTAMVTDNECELTCTIKYENQNQIVTLQTHNGHYLQIECTNNKGQIKVNFDGIKNDNNTKFTLNQTHIINNVPYYQLSMSFQRNTYYLMLNDKNDQVTITKNAREDKTLIAFYTKIYVDNENSMLKTMKHNIQIFIAAICKQYSRKAIPSDIQTVLIRYSFIDDNLNQTLHHINFTKQIYFNPNITNVAIEHEVYFDPHLIKQAFCQRIKEKKDKLLKQNLQNYAKRYNLCEMPYTFVVQHDKIISANTDNIPIKMKQWVTLQQHIQNVEDKYIKSEKKLDEYKSQDINTIMTDKIININVNENIFEDYLKSKRFIQKQYNNEHILIDNCSTNHIYWCFESSVYMDEVVPEYNDNMKEDELMETFIHNVKPSHLRLTLNILQQQVISETNDVQFNLIFQTHEKDNCFQVQSPSTKCRRTSIEKQLYHLQCIQTIINEFDKIEDKMKKIDDRHNLLGKVTKQRIQFKKTISNINISCKIKTLRSRNYLLYEKNTIYLHRTHYRWDKFDNEVYKLTYHFKRHSNTKQCNTIDFRHQYNTSASKGIKKITRKKCITNKFFKDLSKCQRIELKFIQQMRNSNILLKTRFLENIDPYTINLWQTTQNLICAVYLKLQIQLQVGDIVLNFKIVDKHENLHGILMHVCYNSIFNLCIVQMNETEIISNKKNLIDNKIINWLIKYNIKKLLNTNEVCMLITQRCVTPFLIMQDDYDQRQKDTWGYEKYSIVPDDIQFLYMYSKIQLGFANKIQKELELTLQGLFSLDKRTIISSNQISMYLRNVAGIDLQISTCNQTCDSYLLLSAATKAFGIDVKNKYGYNLKTKYKYKYAETKYQYKTYDNDDDDDDNPYKYLKITSSSLHQENILPQTTIEKIDRNIANYYYNN